MQRSLTSVQIMAEIHRQHLLAEAELVRPKVKRRTDRWEGRPRPGAADDVPDRRILIALCAASFLAALNFLAPAPFYPQIARDLGTTVSLLGQVMTLMIMISAGLGLIVGPLGDRYGYRWLLVGGVLGIAINLLGTALAPSYPALLGLSVVGGLADAIVFGLPLAVAGTVFTGEARRRAIGWTFASLSSAAIIGVPILTAIGAVTGWRVALGIGGLIAVVTAGFVAAALPPDRRRPTTTWRVPDILSAYAPLLHHPPTVRLYGASMMRAAWWFGLLTYLGAFLADDLGISTARVGLVYTLGGVGYATGSIAATKWGGHVPPRLIVASGTALGGLLLGPVMGVAGTWLVVLLLALAASATAAAGVATAGLLAAESPAGAGTTMALNGTLLNAGGAIGAALGGGLIAIGGYGALGFGLFGFALVGAALAAWPAQAGHFAGTSIRVPAPPRGLDPSTARE